MDREREREQRREGGITRRFCTKKLPSFGLQKAFGPVKGWRLQKKKGEKIHPSIRDKN